MNSRPTSASTVAVLGAGHIGAAVAHTLVVCGTSERVILYDRQRARAEGEAWDIDDTATSSYPYGVPLEYLYGSRPRVKGGYVARDGHHRSNSPAAKEMP
jgi:glycine/D-amino acid oxidase-like deaminating enzyme